MLRAATRSYSALLLCALVANCSFEHDRQRAAGAVRAAAGTPSGAAGSSNPGGTAGAGGGPDDSAGAQSRDRASSGNAGARGFTGGRAGEGGAVERGGREGYGGAGRRAVAEEGGGLTAGLAGASGQSEGACKPHSVELGVRDTIHVNGADVPACSVGTDGALTMVYTPNEQPDCLVEGFTDPPWRGCEFAANQDLSGFERGLGIIDIEICIQGAPEGEINLWYRDFATRTRKNLVLLYSWEPRDLGCRHLLFRRDDAEAGGHCPARQGPDLKECYVPAAAGAGGEAGESGRAGSGSDGTGTKSTYAQSTLELLSERCDTAQLPAPGTAKPVTVTLRRFTYEPAACLCQSNDDCAGEQTCSRDAWPTVACCTCAGDCPGLCQ
jgi:hypothetical protein